MSATYTARVRVTAPDYETDPEYGYSVGPLSSIKVACIQVVKDAYDCGLREAKQAVERAVDARGQVTLTLIVDEAGLGRIAYRAIDRDAINAGRPLADQLTRIELVQVQRDGAILVVAGG